MSDYMSVQHVLLVINVRETQEYQVPGFSAA